MEAQPSIFVVAPSGMAKAAYSRGTPIDSSTVRWFTGITPMEERVTKPRVVTGHTRRKNPPTGTLLTASTAGYSAKMTRARPT